MRWGGFAVVFGAAELKEDARRRLGGEGRMLYNMGMSCLDELTGQLLLTRVARNYRSDPGPHAPYDTLAKAPHADVRVGETHLPC